MTILSAMMLFGATPAFETFNAPGYEKPVSGVWYGPGEAACGIPLGGLGTGFVELMSDGRLGVTTVENDWLKPVPVSAESGLFVRVGDQTITPKGFWGHWPAADIRFDDTLPVKLYLRAFSLAIPHNYVDSGLPAVFFHYTVRNTGSEPAMVELGVRWKGILERQGQEPPATAPNATTRTLAMVGQGGKGIGLSRPEGSYSVGAIGTGWDVMEDAASPPFIGVTARRTLARNETADVVLGLAWYFPEWTSSDGETLRHRYVARAADADEVLVKGLEHASAYENKIAAWQQKVYAADAPAALKDACINGLYVLAKNSWWMDDGRFFQSESFTGCPITETFVCRFNGSFPLALLWPGLEQATMLEVAKRQAENGQIPFGFGTPMGTRTPMMDLQVPIVSTEFVLTAWRNYELWKDEAYLKQTYPAVKKALQFAMTLDKDGDGVINESPGNEQGFPANQYYDIWPWWGTSAYVGSICLAAWRAGEEMAKRQGDEAFAQEMHDWFQRGIKAFQEKLWTGQYYRLYSGDDKHPASDTSLTNALCGQWFAYASGLGEILPRDRINSVVDTVLRLNVPATPHGAANGVRPDGSRDTSFSDHSAVVTIGEVWNFCATAAFAGRKDEALRLFNTSYENIALRQKTPWNIPWSLDPDTGAIKWGINYYSNPCVWTLLRAADPEAYLACGR